MQLWVVSQEQFFFGGGHPVDEGWAADATYAAAVKTSVCVGVVLEGRGSSRKCHFAVHCPVGWFGRHDGMWWWRVGDDVRGEKLMLLLCLVLGIELN